MFGFKLKLERKMSLKERLKEDLNQARAERDYIIRFNLNSHSKEEFKTALVKIKYINELLQTYD